MPTRPQFVLLAVSTLLFAISGAISLVHMRSPATKPRFASWITLLGGIAIAIMVLLWHAATRQRWLPAGDNFDALIWLAVLLALFVAYMQLTRPLGGIDWFVKPIVVLLLVGAILFGKLDYRTYGKNIWAWVHGVTAYGGAVAFAVAAAGGAMYVLTSRRLRKKKPGGWNFGSLERLERLTMAAVTMGFALLTVGLVTGIMRMMEPGHPTSHTKVLLAVASWLVYAIVLHAPINPRFRGRKAAILSVFGFILMICTLVAVQYMPGGNG